MILSSLQKSTSVWIAVLLALLLPAFASATTTFLEPGGDADFNITLWTSTLAQTVVSDIVHGTHKRSLRGVPGVRSRVQKNNACSDAGTRVSFYIYLVALPNATVPVYMTNSGLGSPTFGDHTRIQISSTGVLSLRYSGSNIGSNGPTLNTGRWYRISLAYTIDSTTVNRFEAFVDGVSAVSVTNATLDAVGGVHCRFTTNDNTNATIDNRYSDIYVDNSSSLTDPGNIWVTAKRPNANGTTNDFVTQVGSGGSGYGTGHSPQVNERAISETNGWSVVATGVTTEEYNIENRETGDINIGPATATIIDYMGWIRAKSLTTETVSIILNNVTTASSTTSTPKTFLAFAGSATYPAGTGTDIGMVTDATETTVTLYEAGVVVAYINDVATSARAIRLIGRVRLLGGVRLLLNEFGLLHFV